MYEPILGQPFSERLLSLDAFRGLTMALMLLVDVAGDNVPALSHAKWDGLHLADFVMPAFLFAMGGSLGAKFKQETRKNILLRFARLFLLGVFIQGSWLPVGKDNIGLDLSSFRIMGILQRIALCYLVVSLLLCLKWRWWLLASLVGVQVGVSLFLKVPGCASASDFTVECNAQSWIDRSIIGSNHMYTSEYDPEGLIATLGCLLPSFAGFVTVKSQRRVSTATGLILTGIGLTFVTNIPFNKALWTLPYNLVTTGASIGLFALLDWCTITRANIFVHLGSNAIFFFVMSDCGGLLSVLLDSIYIEGIGGKRFGIVDWFLDDFLDVPTKPENILVFALIQLAFYFILTRVMFYKKIFYKI